MKTNVGDIDRILRIALGLILVLLAVENDWMWAWIGLIPLATGGMATCPLYSMLGMNTCKVKK